MTQECEKILNLAEKVQKEKSKHRKGIILQTSEDEDEDEAEGKGKISPASALKSHEKNLIDWQAELEKFEKANKQNGANWTEW